MAVDMEAVILDFVSALPPGKSASSEEVARAADPENQVDGFIGGGAADGAQLWSKAGWMSQARHDAAYLEIPGHHPCVLVIFSEGPERAQDEALLPGLTALLTEASTS